MSSQLVICALCLTSLAIIVTSQDAVELRWGIADGSAVVGRLYQMHIPSDAFSGKVVSYQVQTSSGGALPPWIDFDSSRNVLYGIPTRKDLGQLELEVTAKGENPAASQAPAQAVFTIAVRDVASLTYGTPHHPHQAPPPRKGSTVTMSMSSGGSGGAGPEVVRCKREEPETVATIIIDADMETSHVKDRLSLLEKFLTHMNLHHDMVKMVPVGSSPLHDSSALVSGTGDCTEPKTPGMFISWPVGCGQVKEGHFPVLQRLDDDSTNGQMARALGHSVIGWRVSNSHLQAPKRKRRAVMATATAVLTPVMPTQTTDTTGGAISEDPMSRVVPDKTSPVIIQPTATQEPPVTTKTQEPETTPRLEPTTTTTPMEKKSTTPEKTETLPPVEDTTAKPMEKSSTDGGDEGPDDVVTDVPKCVPGLKPTVKQSFGDLSYNVGDVIEFVIPESTFEDCETGGTRGLKLLLFEDTSTEIQRDFFVQFDEKSQKVIGLPMTDDIGRYQMNLVARKGAEVASNTFSLVVKGTKGKKKINHELSVALDLDFDQFITNVTQKTELATKVASIYGDPDASNLVITKMDRGSVLYGWTNKSLSSKSCPADGINSMTGMLVNEDGSLSDNAIEKMKPYVLMGAAAAPSGACEGDPSFRTVASKPRVFKTTVAPSSDDDSTPKKDDGGSINVANATSAPGGKDVREDSTTPSDKVASGSKGGDGDDVLITTVVPAIVIVVILLIALLIACVLYRKKRKGKMNVEEQNTFVNKGAPVIFPDELEDKPNDVNKPLLVECNQAPPPGYHSRGTSESPDRDPLAPNNANNHQAAPPNNSVNNAPPHSSHQHPHDDSITEERPYNPPPPVAASSNSKQPRPTQQPMSQPPQILP